MSNSKRKPYYNIGKANSKDKFLAHKSHRAATRDALSKTDEPDEIYTPTKNIETSDVYSWGVDGGHKYFKKPKNDHRLQKVLEKLKRK